jgi:hypothetical protein
MAAVCLAARSLPTTGLAGTASGDGGSGLPTATGIVSDSATSTGAVSPGSTGTGIGDAFERTTSVGTPESAGLGFFGSSVTRPCP